MPFRQGIPGSCDLEHVLGGDACLRREAQLEEDQPRGWGGGGRQGTVCEVDFALFTEESTRNIEPPDIRGKAAYTP